MIKRFYLLSTEGIYTTIESNFESCLIPETLMEIELARCMVIDAMHASLILRKIAKP